MGTNKPLLSLPTYLMGSECDILGNTLWSWNGVKAGKSCWVWPHWASEPKPAAIYLKNQSWWEFPTLAPGSIWCKRLHGFKPVIEENGKWHRKLKKKSNLVPKKWTKRGQGITNMGWGLSGSLRSQHQFSVTDKSPKQRPTQNQSMRIP